MAELRTKRWLGKDSAEYWLKQAHPSGLGPFPYFATIGYDEMYQSHRIGCHFFSKKIWTLLMHIVQARPESFL